MMVISIYCFKSFQVGFALLTSLVLRSKAHDVSLNQNDISSSVAGN